MKVSNLFVPTLREDPSDAEVISHKLLLRAGMIRKMAGGVYTYLPLAHRVLRKIMQIVREEMDLAGGQEVGLPIIQPREIWEQSGRWKVYGDEMFRLKDRHQRDFCLGPTHEEVITTLVCGDVHSYRELPLMLYQIQDKFRDEIRPRFGLMRGREFIMKDLYSFDVDEAGLEVSYQKMNRAYRRIYDRIGLDYRIVEADSGAIGGDSSHEFMVLANSGESTVTFCDTCDYAANQEKAEAVFVQQESKADPLPMEKCATPHQKTVEEVAAFLHKAPSEILKTLIVIADNKAVAVLLRGDRTLNDIKLKNRLDAVEIRMASEAEVRESCGASAGSVGPVGLSIPIYADQEVVQLVNCVCGTNEEGMHYQNVCPGRDFTWQTAGDFRNAGQGDRCPRCEGTLKETRGIEAGQIFKLGTKYSKALDASFLDEEGNKRLMVMGCYGIGVSRTMAAAIEQNHDADGIIWPMPIAPYQVIVIPVNVNDDAQRQEAERIYQDLTGIGVEVLYDDRNERAGVKFKDADLIGVPIRITVGPKALKANQAEMKKRWQPEAELVDLDKVTETVAALIESLTPKPSV